MIIAYSCENRIASFDRVVLIKRVKKWNFSFRRVYIRCLCLGNVHNGAAACNVIIFISRLYKIAYKAYKIDDVTR